MEKDKNLVAVDWKDQKEKDSRGVSVKDILSNSLARADELETVVVVGLKKDKVVEVGYSWENSLETLGMLDVAKLEIIEVMHETY